MSLTFVPTPLGNLRDITLRALDVLAASDLIVAEDTRVTRRLLSAHGISGKRLVSYREQNAASVTSEIVERARGERVTVVTDAGTPGISDPGRGLIEAARAAGVAIEVLPGPVAFVVAAVLSGFDTTNLSFGGFMPRTKTARETALRTALGAGGPTAWYESPQRIVATLEALAALAPGARTFVGRELTKAFEQQIIGAPQEALRALERPVRGEIVLVVEPELPPASTAPSAAPATSIDAAVDALLDLGLPVSAVAKALAVHDPGGRSAVYARASERKRGRGDGAP